MVRSVAEDELSSQRRGAKQVQRDRHRDREREVHPSEDQEQRDGDPQSGFPAKRRPSSVGSRFSIASDSRFRMVRVHGVTELVYRIKALRGNEGPVGRENPLAKVCGQEAPQSSTWRCALRQGRGHCLELHPRESKIGKPYGLMPSWVTISSRSKYTWTSVTSPPSSFWVAANFSRMGLFVAGIV